MPIDYMPLTCNNINSGRRTINIIKIIPCILILIISGSVHASDLGIGIAGWYADWKLESENGRTRKMDPVLYIGPSISYQFAQSWNTTLVALFTPSPYEMKDDDESLDIKRYDADLTLNYGLTRYIKIFFGGKYLGFFFNGGKHHGAGPGGGIGLTIPVIENFYFLANASALYLWGSHKDEDDTADFAERGYNATAQVAYYAASLGLTTSIGYRYQFVLNDHPEEYTFKGFTVLLVKSFNF